MTTVRKLFHSHTEKLEEFGIEIEVEGPRMFPVVETETWKSVRDGSLRGNSMEYVLRFPVNKDKVSTALTSLQEHITNANAAIHYSMRAGVHVHMNMLDVPIYDVMKFAFVYYVLEDILLEWCGEDRYGNYYCLGLAQAEYIIELLEECAYKPYNFSEYINEDNVKYSALNWSSLTRFGSLEFRSLSTQPSFDNIIEWINILSQIRDMSLKYDKFQEVLIDFSQKSYREWAEYILGDFKYILDGKENIEERLCSNMWMLQEFSYLCDTHREEFESQMQKKKKKNKTETTRARFDPEQLRQLRPQVNLNNQEF